MTGILDPIVCLKYCDLLTQGGHASARLYAPTPLEAQELVKLSKAWRYAMVYHRSCDFSSF